MSSILELIEKPTAEVEVTPLTVHKTVEDELFDSLFGETKKERWKIQFKGLLPRQLQELFVKNETFKLAVGVELAVQDLCEKIKKHTQLELNEQEKNILSEAKQIRKKLFELLKLK